MGRGGGASIFVCQQILPSPMHTVESIAYSFNPLAILDSKLFIFMGYFDHIGGAVNKPHNLGNWDLRIQSEKGGGGRRVDYFGFKPSMNLNDHVLTQTKRVFWTMVHGLLHGT